MASAIVRLGIPRVRKPVLSITDNAHKRLSQMLSEKPKDKPIVGFRLGLKSKGCNGQAYDLTYTDTKNKLDEVVTEGDVTVVIDPRALMSVIGSEMDYVEDNLTSEFVFTNPNAKAVCGCGESFTI